MDRTLPRLRNQQSQPWSVMAGSTPAEKSIDPSAIAGPALISSLPVCLQNNEGGATATLIERG